ncbi:sigma-54-dependent Fis family transcriptional regulator [Haliea sp.]|uniref:sigma-54 interaction domain-containing protein n=1 Tax=Haliea TaxID=475794 RepID=UPI000C455380|nr:sigma-54-dependent Fis family transcriptional regulator [Haliea sp.]HBM84888.1 Fis family transcriptional regulator [Halieaceae bacterium]MAD65372.1 Fis family transcriptional regulator [Haliea sp.]MAY91837.1 Fis family transcriptional regulator [Haliea sp.]MBK42235.1 Fis family transcriptional regulator [Haliea sp.]MBP69318.1 Fis family transcriptional regulator [Haliea sp.]
MSELIATDTNRALAHMLEGYDCAAILVTPEYRILATNSAYRESFGELDAATPAHCFEVSHGYQVPCDQAGESCPLAAARASGKKERVLHVHLSPEGRQHVDVAMLPIHDDAGELLYFVELLTPVTVASAELSTRQMVGRSAAFNALVQLVNLVAPHETSILLLGESGTGKELAASAIHHASARRERPLVAVECAGLTETLFESELFGHVRGAFTGATQDKPGLLESAQGGTLFLDEIGDVPLGMQVKLLRLLETGTWRPVGSTTLRHADFRLICATHKNLAAMVDEGSFRRDLFYRINAFPIHLPALRERREDLALLANSILGKLRDGRPIHLTESAVQRLQQEPFPGNIRELRNVLERALVFAQGDIIDHRILERCIGQTLTPPAAPASAWTDLRTQEIQYLKSLLAHCEGDKARAATIAGISVRSLYRKLGQTLADH